MEESCIVQHSVSVDCLCPFCMVYRCSASLGIAYRVYFRIISAAVLALGSIGLGLLRLGRQKSAGIQLQTDVSHAVRKVS